MSDKFFSRLGEEKIHAKKRRKEKENSLFCPNGKRFERGNESLDPFCIDFCACNTYDNKLEPILFSVYIIVLR